MITLVKRVESPGGVGVVGGWCRELAGTLLLIDDAAWVEMLLQKDLPVM